MASMNKLGGPAAEHPLRERQELRVSAPQLHCAARGLQIFPPLSALGVGSCTNVLLDELLCVTCSSSALP